MIAIISHDAGGAEILSSYAKNVKNKYFFCLSGPAIKIFKKKIKNLINRNLDFCLKNCIEVIASTGETNFEILGIKKFFDNGKKTTAVIDHWCNYKKRFLYNQKYVYPDEIWTSDKVSYMYSKKTFKKSKIRKIKNYYLNDLKKKYKKKTSNNITYFWTPIYTKNYPNLDQIIFREFYNKIYIERFQNLNLVIRPHPSEKLSKYKKIKKKYKSLIISNKKELLDDLQISKITFGFNSMATYISDKLGIESYNIALKNVSNNIFLKNQFGIKNILLKLK